MIMAQCPRLQRRRPVSVNFAPDCQSALATAELQARKVKSLGWRPALEEDISLAGYDFRRPSPTEYLLGIGEKTLP
jgi:hypothetical protein